MRTIKHLKQIFTLSAVLAKSTKHSARLMRWATFFFSSNQSSFTCWAESRTFSASAVPPSSRLLADWTMLSRSNDLSWNYNNNGCCVEAIFSFFREDCYNCINHATGIFLARLLLNFALLLILLSTERREVQKRKISFSVDLLRWRNKNQGPI